MSEKVRQESQSRLKESDGESDVDYAYGVVDAVVEAMQRVTVKPEMTQAFIVDLLQKMPDLVDAMMVITKEEHRAKMAELLRACTEMTGEWVLKMET